MSEYRISYITTPAEVAEQIAMTLVKEELAACVNIIDDVLSIYRWEGQVEKAHESLLIVKSTTDKTDQLIDRVKEIHPYEVPEVITVDITAGNADYLDWLAGKEIALDEYDLSDEDEEEAGLDEEIEFEEEAGAEEEEEKEEKG